MEPVGVGVALAVAVGVVLTGAGFVVFTTFQMSLLPLFTHLKDAVLVFATAPNLVQVPPTFTVEADAESAIGMVTIPTAKTEVARRSEIFFEFMEKRYPLPSARTSRFAYLYCYEKR